jgi:hypothetical protein
MSIHTSFSVCDGYLHVTVTGEIEKSEEAENIRESVVDRVKSENLNKILMDYPSLEGALSISGTFFIAEKWVDCLRGYKIAIVTSQKYLSIDEFATNVATNRGLLSKAFLDADSALKWLLQ